MFRIKKNINLLFLFIILGIGFLTAFLVFADEINYPVSELGNCQNKAECEAYCDDWEHIEECVSFAEANNLFSKEELEKAKKIASALAQGVKLPGGCEGPTQCKVYCEQPTIIEECIDFAEETGIIPAEEAREARLVRKAMLAGIPFPGDCRTKKIVIPTVQNVKMRQNVSLMLAK